MMDITAQYNRGDFLSFLSTRFLPDDFETAREKITPEKSASYIKNTVKLGSCPSLDLSVYEFAHGSRRDPRVSLTREAFAILGRYDNTASNALAVFYNEDSAAWRLSLITSEYSLGKTGKQAKRGFSNPRRFSWLLGAGCKRHTPETMLFTKVKVGAIEDLSSRFAIDVVTKKFYQELFDWYDKWAVNVVKFPVGEGSAACLPKNPDVEANRQHLIRLITRLIFVWFLKQKDHLIPEWIFDKDEVLNVLKSFKSDSLIDGNYYNGIIQNLFFATLNKEITLRGFTEKESRKDYGIKTVYRDHRDSPLFKISREEFIKKFETVPFLNGGLFECLDRREGREKQKYVDGFSREKSRAAFVPNGLFFGDGVSGEHEGIIELFNRYNFTVEENTPQDIDIALDPELLGKVFENLLGTYNDETKSTARNESGSFYTPREIVDYMADISLKEYLKGRLAAEPEESSRTAQKLDALFSYHEEGHGFSAGEVSLLIQAIHNCKILDPACGSGAFPMGILNKLTFILGKLDPENKQWQELQRKKAIADTEDAFTIGDRKQREDRLKEISDVFEFNSGNYGRKLFLIENCIFGVDIQPIAIQISKLRFFISLIVDQKTGGTKENNYNVLPLPNLETKFVAANTLIGVKREQEVLADPEIEKKQQELLVLRHKHFSARKADEKIALREQDEALSQYLADLLRKDGFYNSADAQMMAGWNPYDQTKPSDFFDAYWMFGIKDGFDVVIGNPPYVESRSADVSQELKEKYLEQVLIDFGELSQYITKGSDLLIYFFSRSIHLLKENGCGSLIVQNGWLNTDYGAKMSNFFVNALDYIKVSDSPFRHFDKNSANINTVITLFKKKSAVKSICFDMMKKQGNALLSENLKSFAINENVLTSVKWGVILYTTNEIFNIYQDIINKGSKTDQSFYSIGQGINEKQSVFIPVKEKIKFEQKANIIYAIFKEYKYHYKTFDYFIYHQIKNSSKDINLLKQINAQEFAKDKSIKRKYPAIILPRGIGATHFAGIINGQAFSNSYVDIYMIDNDEEMKLNIWLFCNSSLFFLYREISGRKNLGGGLLKSEATDIKSIPLYFPISDKKTLLSIIENAGNPISLPERLQTPVQKQIDSLVFSYFNIEKYEKLIIHELNRLFNFRNQKAKT